MFKKICRSVTPLLLLAAGPVMAQEVPQVAPPTYNCDFEPACEVSPGIYGKMASPVTSKFKLSIGGYVKFDYAHHSTNMGAAIPGMVSVRTIPKSSSPSASQDQSIFTARQSRMWFKVAGPDFLGAKTSALIETDFYGASGATNNETGALRMRLAYGTLDWKNTQVVFGQAFDVFGPAVPSTVDFGTNGGNGAPAVPRVAQLRVAHRFDLGAGNALQVIAALQNPTQNANLQTGAAGDSWGDTPNFAGQLMFSSRALGFAPGFYGLPMRPLAAGFFGQYGKQSLAGQAEDLKSWGYGAYAFVPILKSSDGKSRAMTASFEGQAFMAANMAANGATGNPFTGPAGARTDAKGWGFHSQLMFHPTQQLGTVVGYGARKVRDNASYVGIANYEKSNEGFYANVAYDLNAAVRVAAEYQHLKTTYGNSTSVGTGNMFGTAESGINNIGRLAFYYFF